MNLWSDDWADCNPFLKQDPLELVDFQRDQLVTNFVRGYFGKKVQVKWNKDKEGNSEDAIEFIDLASLVYSDSENNDERKNASRKLFKMILELVTENRINGDADFLSVHDIGYLEQEKFKRDFKTKIESMDSELKDNSKLLEKIIQVLKIDDSTTTQEKDDDENKTMS